MDAVGDRGAALESAWEHPEDPALLRVPSGRPPLEELHASQVPLSEVVAERGGVHGCGVWVLRLLSVHGVAVVELEVESVDLDAVLGCPQCEVVVAVPGLARSGSGEVDKGKHDTLFDVLRRSKVSVIWYALKSKGRWLAVCQRTRSQTPGTEHSRPAKEIRSINPCACVPEIRIRLQSWSCASPLQLLA